MVVLCVSLLRFLSRIRMPLLSNTWQIQDAIFGRDWLIRFAQNPIRQKYVFFSWNTGPIGQFPQNTLFFLRPLLSPLFYPFRRKKNRHSTSNLAFFGRIYFVRKKIGRFFFKKEFAENSNDIIKTLNLRPNFGWNFSNLFLIYTIQPLFTLPHYSLSSTSRC